MIKLKNIVLFLIVNLVFLSGVYAGQESGKKAAENMQGYIDKINSKSGVKNNLQAPLNSSSKLATLDGSKKFGAQLGCKASSEYLRLTVAPSQTGDVRILAIEQDTDMNGSLDTVSTPTWNISGVCANGFISCQAGSWNACRNMIWTADPSTSNVGAYETALGDLGGCYCINNSCGTGLAWSNLKGILNSLGGGISAALQKVNPYYTVSDTSVTDTTIKFYGSDPTSCGNSSLDDTVGSSSPNNLVAFMDSGSNDLKDAGSSALQSNDVANMLQTSVANNDSTNTYNHCTIRRINPIDEVILEDIVGYNGGTGNVSTCGSDCLLLTMGRVGDNYLSGSCRIYDQSTSFFVKRPDRIKSAKLSYAAFDDWIQVRANNNVIWSGPYNNWNSKTSRPPGKCELSESWRKSPNVEFGQYLKQEGNIDFMVRTEVTGKGEGYVRAQVKVDTSCQLEEDYISDTCTPYREDDSCILVNETVDGVEVYKNYVGTGLSPLPSTRKVSGKNCSFDVTRNWFEKNRTYICKSKSNFDMDFIFDRKSVVTNSANSGNVDVDDIRKNDDGSIENSTVNVVPYYAYAENSCVSVCKTKVDVPQNSISTNGTTGELAETPMISKYSYKECSLDNVCPIESGEQIVQACSCSSDFANATAIMQSVRLAGQDMMCTSGTLRAME
jgi:hypothetical protein